MSDIQNLRYIVFVLDCQHKDHDGKVFASKAEALQFAQDYIDDGYADRAIIGLFLLDPQARELNITFVESIGFKGDRKRVDQLQLFEPIYTNPKKH